jgi:hypothetical protein
MTDNNPAAPPAGKPTLKLKVSRKPRPAEPERAPSPSFKPQHRADDPMSQMQAEMDALAGKPVTRR